MFEPTEKVRKYLTQLFEEDIPLHRFLGLKLLEIKEGYGKVRVPFREEVVGNIRLRRWHGGIIATVMDSIGGLAASTYMTSPEDKIATIDMRIDYLRGAKDSPIVVDGTVLRVGNRTIFTSMRAWQEGADELLAEGRGVYNVRRKSDQG